MPLSPSHTVLSRSHLLEHYIRCQFIDVLADKQCDEFTREERQEALGYVAQLASLRHENPAQTLQALTTGD